MAKHPLHKMIAPRHLISQIRSAVPYRFPGPKNLERINGSLANKAYAPLGWWDIITSAKGISSGYQPLSATIISQEMYDVMSIPQADGAMFTTGFTYSGHPVCCAAGIKNIEIIDDEDICGHVRKVGPYFEEKLGELNDLPLVGEVRGKCFMMCVENVANKETKELLPPEVNVGGRIADHAQKSGLIVRPLGHLNIMSPPLTMTTKQIDEFVGILKGAIEATQDDLVREGVWNS